VFDIDASWNRISQLDRDRLFSDIATSRVTPDIDNMALGEREARQIRHLLGQVTPNIDNMALGEAKEFDLAVMHVDMDDFTGVTGHLSNKDKLRLLNIYLSELTAVIRDYSGFVEKYVGDGISAMFGVGKGGPEAVKNAVECAMTIQAEIKHVMGGYFEKVGLPSFTCSIGMDYGTIWVARVGVKEMNQLTLVGNEVSIAKNLEELAGRGEIFVGECIKARLGQKRQKYCDRQPPNQNFKWELDGKRYRYYEYDGRWVVSNE